MIVCGGGDSFIVKSTTNSFLGLPCAKGKAEVGSTREILEPEASEVVASVQGDVYRKRYRRRWNIIFF